MRLCPFVAPTTEDRVRKILDMLRPKISMVVESGGFQHITVAEYVERAVNGKFHLKQTKKERKNSLRPRRIKKKSQKRV